MSDIFNKPLDKSSKWKQGKFIPKNPHKYIGDIDKIIYRSSWELKVFKFLDDNEYILNWASEPFGIPYMKPCIIKGKQTVKRAMYYPDIYVEFIDNTGLEHHQIIEIKPAKQTKKSKSKKAMVRLQENQTFMINQSKWSAAKQWCLSHNIEFVIATEKSIFS